MTADDMSDYRVRESFQAAICDHIFSSKGSPVPVPLDAVLITGSYAANFVVDDDTSDRRVLGAEPTTTSSSSTGVAINYTVSISGGQSFLEAAVGSLSGLNKKTHSFAELLQYKISSSSNSMEWMQEWSVLVVCSRGMQEIIA